mgnify:CR=1 FL=1
MSNPRADERLRSGPVTRVVRAASWNRPFSEVAKLPSRAPDRLVRYGDSPDQDAEVWVPVSETGAAPLVVLLHGGCWLEEYDRSHARPLAAALAANGFAVYLPGYRRVGQAGGGWPGTFEDIAAAVDRLAEAPIPEVDVGAAVLVGHSAGGQLALWAAGRSLLTPGQALFRPSPFQPRAVIGLAAITDLAAYAGGMNSCQRVTTKLMGGEPDAVPERYAQASPAELGTAIRTVLLQGSEDTIVPPAQARSLPGATVRTIEGAGHFDRIPPGTPAFAMLLDALHEETCR